MSAILIGIASEGRSSNWRKDGHREYKRVYRVRTTSQWDDADSVRSCAGMPARFSPWVMAGENDFAAVMTDINAEQVTGNPNLWLVTCTYSTEIGNFKEQTGDAGGDTTGGGVTDSPVNRPARISFTYVIRQKIFTSTPGDTASDPDNFIGPSNKAEQFDPPILIDEAIPVLTIARYEDNFDPQILVQYVNRVNENAFFGFAPRQVKLQNVTVSEEVGDFGVDHREVTYEFHIHPETWDVQALDIGTKYWSIDRTNLIDTNKRGEPSRFLLDGIGGKLAEGQPPVYLTFKCGQNGPYKTADFSGLNLPQTL